MLNIVIPSVELWDEKNEQFIHTKERKLQLEHSLVSVAKWEAKWNKPFINKKDKTTAGNYRLCAMYDHYTKCTR